MMLSEKIRYLFKFKKAKQADYAKHIGRLPQGLSNSIRDNCLNVDDLINLCDWLGIDINMVDQKTGERIITLNKD